MLAKSRISSKLLHYRLVRYTGIQQEDKRNVWKLYCNKALYTVFLKCVLFNQ